MLLAGLITGCVFLNRHLAFTKLGSDPLCPLCKEDSETSLHFLGFLEVCETITIPLVSLELRIGPELWSPCCMESSTTEPFHCVEDSGVNIVILVELGGGHRRQNRHHSPSVL